MKKLLLLLIALLAGVSGAWADVLPTAVVGTYAFQAQALTIGASDYNISKNGDNDVIISAKNSDNLGTYTVSGGKDYLTCTLVVKINVPSTTSAGVLCHFCQTSDNTTSAQGLYMGADRKLTTSWGTDSRKAYAGETQLAAGEHTIIYTASTGGAKVYIDGTTTTLTDTGLKGGGTYYTVIRIPAAYAQYVTEVHLFNSVQNTTNISSIVTECSNHFHASQQSGESVTVTSGKTLVIDIDQNLSRYSGATEASSIAIAYGKTLTVNDETFKTTYDLSKFIGDGTVNVSGKQTTNIATHTGNFEYTGGAGTSESHVSIEHNGGSVKLTGAEKTYYLAESYSGTASTVNFDGTNANYNGALSIGTATYNINDTQITTPRFITSQGANGRAAVVNLTGDTHITVSGYSDENKNTDSNKSTIMIGHWNGSSNLTLSNTVQIEAVDDQLLIGKTGNTQTITLNDNSNITAKGIKVSANASGTNTLNLNGGSLDLGDVGITSYNNSRSIAVNVNENATITATAATLPISQPITVASGKILTIDGGESDAAVTLTTNPSSLTNNGTIILDGAGLGGSERITTKGVFTIKDLKGNELTSSTNGYALVGNGICTLNLEGTCDFTKKSDGTTPNSHSKLGYGGGSTINIKEGANVTTEAIYNSSTLSSNTAVVVESDATLTCTTYVVSTSLTNNGTITAPQLWGPVTLAAGSTTTLSDATPFNSGAVTVSGDATLNLTNATPTLSQAITVAASKTLTIDGGESNESLTLSSLTNNGTVNFKNVTITLNRSERDLSGYTFTDCTATLQFSETGDEYKAGGFTITNIPTGVTVKVKKYDATDYETVTPVEGTATISHEVGVSGLAAWLDYTFNKTTLATNQPATPIGNIPNRGNAGSGQTLTIDNSQTSAVSYNSDGTFKVRYTPYRGMTWPENYTVAVSGNFPDVENGCLVAFGTKSGNYLALIRGANSNEIKLVKGQGDNTYTNIRTMAAENATAAAHLVVFTKQGNVFKVYCDGVNVATTTYEQTLGGGLQVGSIHGGYANTGVVSVMDNSLTDDQKNAVFCNAIRVYDYIISDAQMDALKSEFPYVSQGGNYTRTISADANLDAEDAWYNVGEGTNTNLPTNNIVEEVTYYPDIVVTTTAASTLTVNANMDSRNIEFDGAGKLTIASDGTHSISIKGSVTANGPISVKYGAIDMSAVPVSIGESGSIEFDFSDYVFSVVTTSTDYPVTGLTSNYGAKVTSVYPDDEDHTYSLAFNSTTNSYYLTVGPSVTLKQKQAIALVTPYYNGGHVGAGLGKYTISLGETSYANMKDFGDAVTAWATIGDCVEPTIVFNMPTNGFYRFTSQNNLAQTGNVGKYLHNYLTDGAIALNSTEDKTTIFYVDCTNNTLLSYDNGLYLNNYNVQPAVGSSSTWTIEEGSELGKYALKWADGWYASDWNTTDKITYGQKDANALWAIEPVESLPITFNAEYASFYSPVDLTIPDNSDLKVYTGTLNGSYLHLDEVEGTLPANTGVILHLDNWSEPTTVNFPVLSTTTSGSSDLIGIIATETVGTNTKLVLGKVDDTWGIYSFNNTTLNGFKAYMNMPATPVKGFTFDLGDAVGIRSIDNGLLTKDNDKVIYNLSGQRISKMQRGVNIVNGKKVIIK